MRELSRSRVTALRRSLLQWYDERARSLPWRRNKSPYRVWVAEVMLQQTRVEVVAPAYRRFLKRFPTLRSLARSAEDDVLSQWSGLGYYSRARALHRAARKLVEDGKRTFPRDINAARNLPGVGPYTAAAVLSIAYDVPLAAVDGNVARVLSRWCRLGLANAAGEPYRSLAQQLLHPDRPGDWNQAVMELGQTVCTPRSPKCAECPVARFCEARRHDQVSAYPKRKARRAAERIELRLLLVHDRAGRLLLERGAFPYLPHLWLPLHRAESGKRKAGSDRRHATHSDGGALEIGSFSHAIVHRMFDVRVYAVDAGSWRPSLDESAERRWFTEAGLTGIGRSALLTKALGILSPASVRPPGHSRARGRADEHVRSRRSGRPRSVPSPPRAGSGGRA